MTPGPDQIIACPNCKELYKLPTKISGSTFGARFWTDGKVEYPMLPTNPEFTKCNKCQEFFWVADAEVLGELQYGEEVTEPNKLHWKEAKEVKSLTYREYLDAIELSKYKDKDQELNLRIWAWWAYNDQFRYLENIRDYNYKLEDRDLILNMDNIIGLLDDKNVDNRIMIAELYRENGYFDDALSILRKDYPYEYSKVVMEIYNYCKSFDQMVKELYFEE